MGWVVVRRKEGAILWGSTVWMRGRMGKTMTILLAACGLTLLLTFAFWLGMTASDLGNNAYYTSHIKGIVRLIRGCVEDADSLDDLGQELRALDDALPYTYETRPAYADIIGNLGFKTYAPVTRDSDSKDRGDARSGTAGGAGPREGEDER